jgi:hypothetical protein
MRARHGLAGDRNAGRRLATALLLTAAACLFAPPAFAQPGAVRITGLEPSRTDSTLDCTVLTGGLPDGRSRQTLASGLPSSLTLSFVLLDAAGRERAGRQAEIRIEPDPWEHTFVVRTPRAAQRVAGFEDLATQLLRLGPMAVAPMRILDPGRPMRLRVRLDVHPLAPAEADRAHSLFVGDMSGNGADRREVSTGFGSLLRYFLRRTPASQSTTEATSEPFAPRELPRTP